MLYDSVIPGLANYMENEDIPLPTKEEDDKYEEPVIRDIDDKDPHDPKQCDIVIEIDDNNDGTTPPQVEDAVPEVTPVEEVAEPTTEGDHVTQMHLTLSEYRTWVNRSSNKLIDQCDFHLKLVKNVNRGVVGQEGFTDLVKNAVTGIANITGHLLNLFKTALLNGFRDFKRSELSEYSDSNRMTMTRLYAADNYGRLRGHEVPVPRGMEGTYADALKAIQDALNAINILEKAKQAKEVINSVYKDLQLGQTGFTSQVTDMNRKLKSNEVNRMFDRECKIFTTKKNDMGYFDKLFASMKQYEEVVKDTIDMDTEFRLVSSVYDYLQEIDETVGKIVPLADKMNKQQLDELASMVRLVAEFFDMYANVVQDLNRFNHNLTEVTQSIRDFLQM